ncbi:MAG TPA: caspase domain-containing protein [Xanthobacteraceae bacterium]|nr:caspase domain-containing protein [Xanthobacteraceae bacterium]
MNSVAPLGPTAFGLQGVCGMTRRIDCRGFLAGLIAAATLTCTAASAQDRVALVVGNAGYVNANVLPNPGNDARAVARTLREIGFDVAEGFDLDRNGMERMVREFLHKTATARLALLFYAGHGLQVDGRNYLVPVDAKLESPSDLSFETIELDKILDNLNDSSRANIIILDACRDNPLARTFAARLGASRSAAVSSGLAGYSNLGTGTLIAFSTAPGAVALDGNGANSPFTRALARHMRTPGLEVRQMLTRVRADVAAETRSRQIPWDNSSLLGEVYLAGPVRPEQQRVDVVPAPAADEILWGTIKDSGLSAMFQEFVKKYPDSPHTAEARARADQLKNKEVAMLPPAAGVQIDKLKEAAEPANGPIASFTRHNGGWTVVFSFAEPATGISWRLGETVDFRETGFLDTLDPRTRKRMPNPAIQLDADQAATTIYVRYVDASGTLAGPFPIRFDPDAALEREQRKILEMTAGSWLAFREFNGLLLYYTHLMSYRCAIRQVRIGLDSAVPDRAITLPPCNRKDPMAIPSDAQPYLKVPPTTRSVSVELTFRDGSVSELKTFRR